MPIYFYTLFLDMKYSDARTLTAEVVSIYILVGRGWLVTIHSAKVDLMSTTVYRFLEEKNRPTLESSIDALYYTQHSFKHRRQVRAAADRDRAERD
jgi:Mg2+ and Co2+ transporter CorA